MGLLHEKVRDAMSPIFAELLIEFITATPLALFANSINMGLYFALSPVFPFPK